MVVRLRRGRGLTAAVVRRRVLVAVLRLRRTAIFLPRFGLIIIKLEAGFFAFTQAIVISSLRPPFRAYLKFVSASFLSLRQGHLQALGETQSRMPSAVMK